ncbi:hypothetical protein HELRODRAFT_174290 [Helobdella robusta]|uniref:Uncharacterized protein n=1 Tax=Helobdella robusta TaxID=6412 RepID=T1F7Y3_HELRO|nr:hypothetical protein HELRODRAFT_174290 [Helobdella robusta]ESO02856.1 hypothetical protein HELRODRAFT_174290 [Helobdella robusta]
MATHSSEKTALAGNVKEALSSIRSHPSLLKFTSFRLMLSMMHWKPIVSSALLTVYTLYSGIPPTKIISPFIKYLLRKKNKFMRSGSILKATKYINKLILNFNSKTFSNSKRGSKAMRDQQIDANTLNTHFASMSTDPSYKTLPTKATTINSRHQHQHTPYSVLHMLTKACPSEKSDEHKNEEHENEDQVTALRVCINKDDRQNAQCRNLAIAGSGTRLGHEGERQKREIN